MKKQLTHQDFSRKGGQSRSPHKRLAARRNVIKAQKALREKRSSIQNKYSQNDK